MAADVSTNRASGNKWTSPADGVDIVSRYDATMYDPEHVAYFGQSDFSNFGYWEPGIAGQREACERLVEKLLSLLPDRTGTILDVACGKGATTQHLLKYYPPSAVTGINISAKQLETARANAPGCRFLEMDAAALEFEDGSFDSIICVEAAFHFNTREKFLREARRVLKPGGHLALSDILMTREAEAGRAYRTEKNYVEGPSTYAALLQRTGFEDVGVIDATRECWEGCFWNAVRYAHARYFAREIHADALKGFLNLTYRRVGDIQYYLLAAGRKGVEP